LAFCFANRDVGIDPNNDKLIIAPYVVWEAEHVDVSAAEAMQAANEFKSPTARDAAKQFLREMLIKAPVASSEVDEAAKANGIAKRTLIRAKNELNIIAKKDPGPDGFWKWHLPDYEAWTGTLEEECQLLPVERIGILGILPIHSNDKALALLLFWQRCQE
jgi:hypothetical protein